MRAQVCRAIYIKKKSGDIMSNVDITFTKVRGHVLSPLFQSVANRG